MGLVLLHFFFIIISTYFGAPKGRSIKFMQKHLPDVYNHAIQHILLVSPQKIVGLGNCFRQIFRKKKNYILVKVAYEVIRAKLLQLKQ